MNFESTLWYDWNLFSLINFLSVEETHEPREIQDVKIETEIEVLDQLETQESLSETNIEAGNELKGTPDLLEQAVSQIKIHRVEIKATKGQMKSECIYAEFFAIINFQNTTEKNW